MFENFDDVLKFLVKIESMPTAGLLFLSSIGIGYAWRFLPPKVTIRWLPAGRFPNACITFGFPNNAIPVGVMLYAALVMVMATPIPEGMITRIFIFRSLMQGLVIGFAAWLSHALVIKRIEDWIAKKFPETQDSKLFTKPDMSADELAKSTKVDETPKP